MDLPILYYFAFVVIIIFTFFEELYSCFEQVRYPVLLTPTEKEMAREVCVAFGQSVRLIFSCRLKDDFFSFFFTNEIT